MNKQLLALVLVSVSLFSGCQSISDQIGSQLAKTVIEQSSGGAVKIDDLEKGKFTIKTEDGTIAVDGNDQNGSFKMTDKNGKEIVTSSGQDGTFTVKDENGQVVMKGDENSLTVKDKDGKEATYKSSEGATRPADAPDDMPTQAGAKDFNLVTMGDLLNLSYTVAGADVKAICATEASAIEGKGWTTDAKGISMESEDSVFKNYVKGEATLLLTCGKSGEETSVNIQKGKKQA